MTFGQAVKQAMEHGGGKVIDDNAPITEYTVNETGTVMLSGGGHCVTGRTWHVEQQQPPQPAPEPELLTMAMAIAKAVEMGGGEVWKGEEKLLIIQPSGVKSHFLGFLDIAWNLSIYTVRPLPDPYPMDFAEAWEALGRGESVEFIGESGNISKIDKYTSITAKALHGRRFRIANERKET